MKRVMIAALAAMLLCCGCGNEKGPGPVDTVVWIPVDPTESIPPESETQVSATEATAPQDTEPETEPEVTEVKEQPASTGKKPGSNKKPSGSSASKETEPKETKPKETKPPKETEPEPTKPAATEPPETEPEQTQVPSTEPENTEPEATEPEGTDPEPTNPPLYDISGYTVGSLEYAIRDEINASREGSSLKLDSRLCAIASCRANEISRVWSHTRPDGRHYSTVLSDYGYGAGGVTELLVYVTGQGDAASIVGKWLESDSHRQNLLSDGYTTLGVGIYRSGGYTYICCLLIS